MKERGVTLLELLLAGAIMGGVIIAVSLTFPTASKSMRDNRRRWVASNWAASKIQELKAKPYGNIKITPAGVLNAWFTNITNSPGPGYQPPACNCDTANMQAVPDQDPANPDLPMVESGVTYTRKVCVSLVYNPTPLAPPPTNPWTSFCPDAGPTSATDKGLKNIRVRVSWAMSPSDPYEFIDMESMAAR